MREYQLSLDSNELEVRQAVLAYTFTLTVVLVFESLVVGGPSSVRSSSLLLGYSI